MEKIEFNVLPEFSKDLKLLTKRFRSLPEDLEVLRKVLGDEPDEMPPFSFRIEGLGLSTCLIKVRKIACKSLKGRGVNSGIRLIYAYFESKGLVTFVEIYHKSDKTMEDRTRITKNFY